MEFLVKITDLDHMGRGIGKIDGKIIFVAGVYIGEEVLVKITKEKKKFLEGEVICFQTKSPFRNIPKCDVKNCGCHLNYLDYEKQLLYKEEKVKNIMKRYVNINNVSSIVPSSLKNNYRNKVTFKVNNYLAYSENGTHNLICVKKCDLLDEKINKLIIEINKLDLSEVKEVMIRTFEETMICFKGNVDFGNLKSLCDSIYINDKLVHGKEKITCNLDKFKFLVSDKAFFQVNTKMAEKLYNLVASLITKDKNKTLLDLYCGTGTIGIFLSEYFKKVIGIEINEKAVIDARENAKINGINNTNFRCLNLDNGFDEKADILIVDPPRKGLGSKTVADILKINPEEIIYVSCDPMTLARDLNLLKENYDVLKIIPVDMFPHTYHVECVSVLHCKTFEK